MIEPWRAIVQFASFAVAGVCFIVLYRLNRRLLRMNHALSAELEKAHSFLAAMFSMDGPNAMRACQVCGQRIKANDPAIIRVVGGRMTFGHAICFPPMPE